MDAHNQTLKYFELYAVKYGTSLFPGSSIYNGDVSGKRFPFAWLFFVIKTNDKVILVDTGFSDEKRAHDYGVTLTDISSPLASIGVTPKSVTDIIITHAHFDHTGRIDMYPSAKVFVHKNERAKFMPYCSDLSRATYFENTYQFSSSISVECIAGHTAGSCAVWLDDGKNQMVLTGDEAYLLDNINSVTAIGSLYNLQANRAFLKKVHDLHIPAYTFHDPAIVKEGSVIQKLYP
jgi:N-acyl homoserine lactone hydrolase